jgi:biopolymer transport protein ExbD
MLTSTLVAPNAIKLLLPSSKSKTMSTQTLTVYINKERNIYVNEQKVDPVNLENAIFSQISNEQEASVVLRSDKTATVQDIVVVIDAVNEINNKHNTKHKVILATKPNR